MQRCELHLRKSLTQHLFTAVISMDTTTLRLRLQLGVKPAKVLQCVPLFAYACCEVLHVLCELGLRVI